MKETLILLCSLVAGGCGYLVVTFWMNPILRYLQIRHEVTSDLIFFANIIILDELGDDDLKKRHSTRQEHNRKHAAEMVACYYRLPHWYKRLLELRQEMPCNASSNLIGLSNCKNRETAETHIKCLKENLKLDPKLDV
jgi:hypothetical protein